MLSTNIIHAIIYTYDEMFFIKYKVVFIDTDKTLLGRYSVEESKNIKVLIKFMDLLT